LFICVPRAIDFGAVDILGEEITSDSTDQFLSNLRLRKIGI
jgi:hypothetical protein